MIGDHVVGPLCILLPREPDLPSKGGVKVEFRGLLLERSGGHQARVLYDYNAVSDDEITVVAGWVSEYLVHCRPISEPSHCCSLWVPAASAAGIGSSIWAEKVALLLQACLSECFF